MGLGSLPRSREPGWQGCEERGKTGKGKGGGPCPAAENVISRLGGETNSCCQPDLVKAMEEPEWNWDFRTGASRDVCHSFFFFFFFHPVLVSLSGVTALTPSFMLNVCCHTVSTHEVYVSKTISGTDHALGSHSVPLCSFYRMSRQRKRNGVLIYWDW